MKRKTLFIIIAIIIAVVAAWFFFFRKEEQVATLTTHKPRIGHIAESVTATGTVEPVDTVAVGTQVSGTVNKIYVDFNSTVKQGQLLAELDKTLFQASVDQAAANVASQQSALIYQQNQYNREKQLYDVGAISRSEYDDATFNYRAAQASVSNAQAQLRSAQKNLSLSSIYSPINGTVLSRDISVGQTVAASFNTPTLFVIAKDITKMQVKANVDEADIGSVADSQRATFTVDAFLNNIFKGRVQEIRLNPTTSSNVVTYTTIINAPNEDKKLKPGMTANITIFTKESDSALLVSVKALKFKPDSSQLKKYHVVPLKDIAEQSQRTQQKANNTSLAETVDSSNIIGYVWVKQGNNIVQKKVVTGLNDNTHVEILSGLSLNDEIVTDANTSGKGQQNASDQASSPFMPRRPQGNRNSGGGRRS